MATKPSLDDLAAKPDDELTLKDIVNGMQDLKLSLQQRLTSIEIRLNEIDEVKGDIKTLRDDLEVTKAQVGALAAAECPFPPDLSLIVSNLPGEENEDQTALLQTVESLVHEGLELTDIVVQAVERTAPRTYAEATVGEENEDERPGVVKVKLGSLQQKIGCLRNKRKLKTKSVYKKVYVRGCEDHASRVARNMDTLLQELDLKGSFRFTGSGKMIKKTIWMISIRTLVVMHRVVVEMVTSPEESRDCNPVIQEVVGLPAVMATEEDAAVVAVVVHIRRLTNQILFHSLHGMSLAGLNIIVN